MCAFVFRVSGGMDPDCFDNFNNMYCDEVRDSTGAPQPVPWDAGYQCVVSSGSSAVAHCSREESTAVVTEPDCPQLPATSPRQLMGLWSRGNPPPEWTCDPMLYDELDSKGLQEPTAASLEATCNCECGIIDPDCGYKLPSCDDQTWYCSCALGVG